MSRLLIVLLFLSSATFAGPKAKIIDAPDSKLTPGKLCTTEDPDYWRTFDHDGIGTDICKRNVNYGTKMKVLSLYLGGKVSKKVRKQYKIDHFIPLNIGGSNHITNLFPIHKKVMGVYERVEWPVYQAFRKNVVTQVEAVEFVKAWKSLSYDFNWVIENEGELLEWEEQFPNPYNN